MERIFKFGFKDQSLSPLAQGLSLLTACAAALTLASAAGSTRPLAATLSYVQQGCVCVLGVGGGIEQ